MYLHGCARSGIVCLLAQFSLPVAILRIATIQGKDCLSLCSVRSSASLRACSWLAASMKSPIAGAKDTDFSRSAGACKAAGGTSGRGDSQSPKRTLSQDLPPWQRTSPVAPASPESRRDRFGQRRMGVAKQTRKPHQSLAFLGQG